MEGKDKKERDKEQERDSISESSQLVQDQSSKH